MPSDPPSKPTLWQREGNRILTAFVLAVVAVLLWVQVNDIACLERLLDTCNEWKVRIVN